jgi:hypothetical protein
LVAGVDGLFVEYKRIKAIAYHMDVFKRIDDIVWGESGDVWNNTFALLMRETPNTGVMDDIVMKGIVVKYEEYKCMYYKVLEINNELGESEGVMKLLLHYQKIMSRYRSAYSSCRSYEYAL